MIAPTVTNIYPWSASLGQAKNAGPCESNGTLSGLERNGGTAMIPTLSISDGRNIQNHVIQILYTAELATQDGGLVGADTHSMYTRTAFCSRLELLCVIDD